MFAGQFSENVRHIAILQQYRIIADSILALAGLSCFQHGEVNMFPVSVELPTSVKMLSNGATANRSLPQ